VVPKERGEEVGKGWAGWMEQRRRKEMTFLAFVISFHHGSSFLSFQSSFYLFFSPDDGGCAM
jgi:hypothetical protein